jgi:hypothetical protein
MVKSTHNTFPYPPQMRNGGSSPAHLSSSSLSGSSDPSWWLQFKWSQPPSRAPEWLFGYYRSYTNPPANVGQPPPYKEWLQRTIREDQEAAGLLPPEQPYWGPLEDPLVSGDGQTVSYQPHIHANTIRSSREQHRCSHNL